ncbi:MAG: hypothetical protein FJ387_11655 [Verrucomicrobia bacterium]|nr:hypothetical protein [Verrucomicrobiota bacterium]
MVTTLTRDDEARLRQTIAMFEVIAQSDPHDRESLEILKEAYSKLGQQGEVAALTKRIARLCLDHGEFSAAILEYESLLDTCPGDREVRAALADIENRIISSAPGGSGSETVFQPAPAPAEALATAAVALRPATDVEDGREEFQRIYVEGRLLNPADFEACWPGDAAGCWGAEAGVPFIQALADKGLMPLEQSLRLLCDHARLCYLPLERYDLDIEWVRQFPRELCQRWCVVPFDRMSKAVLVATANPFHQRAAEAMRVAAKGRLLWYIASPSELTKVLRKAFH